MALTFFRGKNGRGNARPGQATSPALVPTASSTVSFAVPVTARAAFLQQIAYTASNQAAGGGAITVQVKKVRSGVSTNLTAAQTITSTFVTNASGGTFVVPFLSTLSDIDRSIQPGDRIQVDIVAASTITTAPTAAHIVVDFDRID